MTKRLATHLFALVIALSVVSGARAYAPKSHAEITDPSPKTALRAFSEFSPNSDRRIGSEVFERTRKNRPATTNFAKDLSLDPWGSIALTQGNSQNRKLFTGHQSDFATGLVYAKARYYDPSTGGFLTQDPMAGSDMTQPFTFNAYRYAFHNPMAYTDPTGQLEVFDKARKFLQGGMNEIDRSGVAAQQSLENCVSEGGSGCSNIGLDALRGVYDLERGATQGVLGTADMILAGLNFVGDSAVALGVPALAEDQASAAHNLGMVQSNSEQLGRDAREIGSSLSADATGTLGTIASGLGDSAASFGRRAFIEGDASARASVGEFASGVLTGGPKVSTSFRSVTSSARTAAQVTRSAAVTIVRNAPKVVGEVASAAKTFGRSVRRYGSAFDSAFIGSASADATLAAGLGGAGGVGKRLYDAHVKAWRAVRRSADEMANWEGGKVQRYHGHEWSPLDPSISEPPIFDPGPFTAQQRQAFLRGESGGTKLAPHHRHQLPVETHGGVIDELPGPGHPAGNIHTKDVNGVSRHPGASFFRNAPGGEAQRAREIRNHFRGKGKRLIEDPDFPGLYIDPGPK